MTPSTAGPTRTPCYIEISHQYEHQLPTPFELERRSISRCKDTYPSACTRTPPAKFPRQAAWQEPPRPCSWRSPASLRARRPGGPRDERRAGARGRRPRRVRALDGAQHDLGHDVDDLDASLDRGVPVWQPVSFADGGTGNPYMCVSPLDSSVKDLQANPKFSLTLSAAQGQNAPAACAPESGRGDPENPPCARLALTGDFVDVAGGPEFNTAVAALNATILP